MLNVKKRKHQITAVYFILLFSLLLSGSLLTGHISLTYYYPPVIGKETMDRSLRLFLFCLFVGTYGESKVRGKEGGGYKNV